jgi:predicted DNA-binding protein (MmcQ/YjbR family)
MSSTTRRYFDSVPPDIEDRLRNMCISLPETYEERAWAGVRWMVRKKTFAHVLSIDQSRDGTSDTDSLVVLAFRSSGEELEMLRQAGHPFFVLGWGRNAMGLVLDDATDWDEVRELTTESYRVMAPKKLRAHINNALP